MKNYDELLANPNFHIGLGLLGGRGSFNNVVSRGLLGGTNNYMLAQEMLANKQARQQAAQQAMQQQQARQQVFQQMGMPQSVATGFPGVADEYIKRQLIPETQKPTSLMQNLEAAGLVPGTPEYNLAILNSINKPLVQIQDGPKLPANYQWKDPLNPGAGVKPIPGGPATKATEGEASSAGFAKRMQEAETRMNQIVGEGYDPGSYVEEWRTITNFTTSREKQVYRQAQEDWVRAKLRKESGAVIGPEEMEQEIKTYFPQPGDSKDVIAAKKRSREIATMNLINQSQGAYERDYGNGNTASEIPKLPDGFEIVK